MTRPKWNGKRIDKEIGTMSARSPQRTRWRRWRMGRDIAGRKDRDGWMSGSEAQVVGGDEALIPLLLLLFPPFALRRVEVLPTLLFPNVSLIPLPMMSFGGSERMGTKAGTTPQNTAICHGDGGQCIPARSPRIYATGHCRAGVVALAPPAGGTSNTLCHASGV